MANKNHVCAVDTDYSPRFHTSPPPSIMFRKDDCLSTFIYTVEIKVELLLHVRGFDHSDGPHQTKKRISVIRVQCLTVCYKYISPECVRRMALHYMSVFHLYMGPKTNCERLVIAYAFGRVEK